MLQNTLFCKIILVFSCLLNFLLFSSPVFAENNRSMFASFKQTLFNSGNGMLSDEVNALVQSHDGYVWIGGYAGLVRYNGQVFQQMKDRNNQTIERVSCLYEDAKQRVWIGTMDEGIFFCKNGLIQKLENLRAPNQKAIVEDREGRIYIASAEGIAVYDDREKDTVQWIEDSRIKNHMVVSLAAEDTGRIWGVTYDGDVFCLNDCRLESYISKQSFKGHLPKYVFCDKTGIIYLGTTDNTIIRIGSYANGAASADSLNLRMISTGEIEDHLCMYQDQDGRLLVCAHNGIGFFDWDMNFHRVEGGVFESSFGQVIQDNYGSYWLASSDSGALHIAKTRFKDVTARTLAPEAVYNAVIKYQGNLYMGSDAGLFILGADNRPVTNALTDLLRGIRVRYFAKDRNDNLWIATYRKQGLLRYKDGDWQQWGPAEGMPTEKIRVLLACKNGDVAAGTENGLVLMRDNAIYRIYNRNNSAVRNAVILSLCEDSQGNLYIGSDGDGIYKLEPDGAIQSVQTADNGEPLGSVLSMEWDERCNGMWISNGKGIYFLKDEKVSKIDTGTLNVNNLFRIARSPEGLKENKLYMFSSQMIQSVDLDELQDPKAEKSEKMKSYRCLTYDNTLNSSLTLNACHYYSPEDRKLYLACSRNVLQLDTARNWESAVQPRAMIDSIQIHRPDGTVYSVPYDGEISIPHDFTQMDIKFGIISFSDAQSDLYYYLEGYDKEPIYVEGKQAHDVHYSTLPGGEYVFHVIARSRNKTYQSEMTATLKKQKTWTEENWVRALFLLVGGGLLIRLTYLITKKRNEKKLAEAQREAAVAKKIAELEAKNALAEKERADAEAEKARAEKERAEVAELKRRMEEEFTERTILTISNTIDAKDRYTNGHSRRVAQYTLEIGKQEGFSTEELRELYYAALLHDIGKIAIPDIILNKPSKLTDEEYGVIKSHTSRGANILNQMQNQHLADGAHYHHERYDGRGYPEKLAGKNIPVYGRMIAVADVVDAMYSKRVYKPSITMDLVIEELKKCAGTQLDPKYAADMIRVLESGFVADENRETIFDREW